MEKNVSKFDEKFTKNYDQDSNKEYILEVDVECPKDLHNFYSDLPFLSERMENKKYNKFACNLYDKKKCCSYKTSKTSIESWTDI